MIEDDPADADLIREAFKNFEVRTRLGVFNDGEEALAYLRKSRNDDRPDLILLDLSLPKMDGREVLSQLKSDERLRSIPVIVLTTSSAEADILQCYTSGANCFVTKPLGIDDYFRMTKTIERFWLRLVRLPSRAGAPARSP